MDGILRTKSVDPCFVALFFFFACCRDFFDREGRIVQCPRRIHHLRIVWCILLVVHE